MSDDNTCSNWITYALSNPNYQLIKADLRNWAELQPLNVLQKFDKFRKLEETSDQLFGKLPEIPRDLLNYKVHYVFNGILKQVNERRYVIEHAKDEANDADAGAFLGLKFLGGQ